MNNVVTTLAPSFLIGSSSFLQATSYPIISRNVVTIPAFIFESIIFILADKRDNYENLDEYEFRQDPITYYGVSCP